MPQINFARREILCKLVYYGPGQSGKTTNLEMIHKRTPTDRHGELIQVATEGDRTLFFDYMPLDLGDVAGMRTKFQLYTVPGQVYYNATRELVLRGADGVVFVADAREEQLEANLESLANLEENLAAQGMRVDELPVVIQWNKRDMPTALPVEVLEAKLNPRGWPSFSAVALTGEGVFPTLKLLAKRVLKRLHDDYVGDPAPRPIAPPRAVAPTRPEPEPEAVAAVEPKRRPAQRPARRPATPTPPRPVVAAAPAPIPVPRPERRSWRAALLAALLLIVAAIAVVGPSLSR